jgi:hypothetical protein
MKGDKQIEVVYPQSSDAADFTFYNNQIPYFYEYQHRDCYVLPNHVVLFYNGADNWANVAAVESEDASSIAKFGDVYAPVPMAEIVDAGVAQERADAIKGRYISETDAGTLIIPHDCRIELYDKIAVSVV